MEISSSLTLTATLPPSLPLSSFNSAFFSPPISPSSSLANGLRTSNSREVNPLTGGLTGRVWRNERARKKRGLSCNALFGLGVPELVVIAGVAALVFGPKKLPEVGRSIGKTVKSFQQAAKEFESELKKEPDSTTDPSLDKPKEVKEEQKDNLDSSSKESV